MATLKVAELFAGVGGFRLGLERVPGRYEVVWSNQWEPARKKQDASDIYVARFGATGHNNQDIATVEVETIPDHDLLVGGFPCQDYSVARTLNRSDGLAGKKGVLWWQIHRILQEKKHKPGYLFLENVDRLLQSPAKQRGRDFAVMLASLADLGYAVEWRVINAADYGMPQRRRRIFFLGFHRSTPLGQALLAHKHPEEWILEDGIFAEAFPVTSALPLPHAFGIKGDLADITETFNAGATRGTSPFANAGLMADRQVHTLRVQPAYQGPRTMLGHILQPDGEVPAEYFVDAAQHARWAYLKGGKHETRTNKASGFTYHYSEGAMAFPDPLDKPARTIITAEGGPTPSRFKHVVRTADGRLRRLTPLELERLNMFPDDHTAGLSPARRAFLMGNALVTGIVERTGAVLARRVEAGR
ncbi:MAG: DNA (cytosine-5-)-methyltransferase [Bacteroidetes bacterium]|nr:DNA (cytosine-5-)-methyltransferase [Bacteroidota bacterium]